METAERTLIAERPSTSGDADRDLERRVTSFLAARHVPGLRYLAVKATGGVVTVSGQVLTFYEKQLCNQCCRRVAGVMELINAVSVTSAPSAAVA
jgi:osmotically-inducible protein OsmY